MRIVEADEGSVNLRSANDDRRLGCGNIEGMTMLPGDARASTTPIHTNVVKRAAESAQAAARLAGVTIRTLQTPPEMAKAAELVAAAWKSHDTFPLDASLLRALAHTGNFVVGAFEDAGPARGRVGERPAQPDPDALVGLSVGFLTVEPKHGLHSHITCTAAGRRDAGVGAALKLHQRAWALAAGLTSVVWTVDPLVRRNAYFNFAKLGARAVAYLPDFYGPMDDGVNAGDESDRLLMTWSLSDALPGETSTGRRRTERPELNGCFALTVGPGEEPCRFDVTGGVVACQVPADIVALRERDPHQALRWRHELRDSLHGALSAGYHVQDFTRSGCYVLTRDPVHRETSNGR